MTHVLKSQPEASVSIEVDASGEKSTSTSVTVVGYYSSIKHVLSDKPLRTPSHLLCDEDRLDLKAAEEALRDPVRYSLEDVKRQLGLK